MPYRTPPKPNPAFEEERQRMVSTHLLCEILPSLAQLQGTVTFEQYTPEHTLPGRKITRDTIAKAQQALEQMATVWEQRNLP